MGFYCVQSMSVYMSWPQLVVSKGTMTQTGMNIKNSLKFSLESTSLKLHVTNLFCDLVYAAEVERKGSVWTCVPDTGTQGDLVFWSAVWRQRHCGMAENGQEGKMIIFTLKAQES